MLRNSPCTRRSMEFANNDKISGHNLARSSQERKCRPIQLHYPAAHMYRRLPQNPKPFLNVKPMISQPAVVKQNNLWKHITKQSRQARKDTTHCWPWRCDNNTTTTLCSKIVFVASNSLANSNGTAFNRSLHTYLVLSWPWAGIQWQMVVPSTAIQTSRVHIRSQRSGTD